MKAMSRLPEAELLQQQNYSQEQHRLAEGSRAKQNCFRTKLFPETENSRIRVGRRIRLNVHTIRITLSNSFKNQSVPTEFYQINIR
jgi:hypothetical protein